MRQDRPPRAARLCMLALAGLGPAQTPAAPPAPPPAQAPPAQPTPQPQPLSIDGTLHELARAYRDAPVAEACTIRVIEDAEGRSASARAVVRIDRASHRLRLELGPLTVSASGTELIAVVRGDPDRAAVWQLEAPWTPADLQRLPPVLLPHPALAFSDDPALGEPLPGVAGVVWQSVRRLSPPGSRPTLELAGASPHADLRLSLDPATHRLVRLSMDWRGGGDLRRYELAFTPSEPGDPSAWPVSLEGRARVESLVDLAPRSTLLPKGENLLRAFTLRDPANREWGGDDAAPDPLVLLALRIDQDDEGVDPGPDAALGLIGIAEAISRSPGPAAVRVVAVFEPEGFSAETLRRIDASWSPALALAEGEPIAQARSRVLWSGAGERFFNALQPGARAVAVVLKADGTLVGVAPLDGRAEAHGEVRDELLRALKAARD